MSFSALLVRSLVAELARRGVPTKSLFRNGGLDASVLEDAHFTLSALDANLLLQEAIALTGEPGLGLSVGDNTPARSFQLLGCATLFADSLRDALAMAGRFVSVLVPELSVELVELDGVHTRIRFQGELSRRRDHAARFVAEFCLVAMQRLVSNFAARSSIVQVSFRHEHRDGHAPYSAVFGCPVLFGQPSDELWLQTRALDQPMEAVGGSIQGYLREAAEACLSELHHGGSVSSRVRKLMRAQLAEDELNGSAIAKQLGLSVRALTRRLANEQQTLTGILDEERCRVARRELSRADACIKSTAARLGYSEPSSFHRAFRRWTGQTPGDYCKNSQLAVRRPARAALEVVRGEVSRPANRAAAGM